MGSDIHVTRKAEWSDPAGSHITESEWLTFDESDPSMRLDGFAQAETTEGALVRVESPGLTVWEGYSGGGQDGNQAWFRRSSAGNIVLKNPDQEILQKMYAIAESFGAKVQGDEGEEYGSDGRPEGDHVQAPATRRSWWRFWS